MSRITDTLDLEVESGTSAGQSFEIKHFPPVQHYHANINLQRNRN